MYVLHRVLIDLHTLKASEGVNLVVNEEWVYLAIVSAWHMFL